MGINVVPSGGFNRELVDAKGDIIAATAADTVARVAVGTDGQALIASSTSAAGVTWGNAGTPSVSGKISDGAAYSTAYSLPATLNAGTYIMTQNQAATVTVGSATSSSTSAILINTSNTSSANINVAPISAWKNRLSSNAGAYLAIGNSRYVTVSSSGTASENYARSSTDLITWTSRSIGATSGYPQSLAFGVNKFVALTGTPVSVSFQSTDGLTWSTNGGSGNMYCYGVDYRSDFVAASKWFGWGSQYGGGNVIEYSTDANAWNSSSFGGAGTSINVVFAGPGVALAASDAGVFRGTTNWTTWSSRTPAVAGSYSSGIYGDKYVWCMDSGKIQTSADGTTWVQRTTPASGTNRSIAWTSGKYAVQTGDTGQIMISTDAITWSLRTSTGLPSSNASHGRFKYGNGYFVMLISSSIWTSPDGEGVVSGDYYVNITGPVSITTII